MGMNKCMFIGNLGKDPEMMVAQSGVKVCRFSIAVNEKRKNTEETTWVNVTTFDKLAEIVSQYTSKGQLVYVCGRIKAPKVFSRQDGTQAASLDLLADQVIFLERKRDAEPQQQSADPGSFAGGFSDNDIPL